MNCELHVFHTFHSHNSVIDCRRDLPQGTLEEQGKEWQSEMKLLINYCFCFHKHDMKTAQHQKYVLKFFKGWFEIALSYAVWLIKVMCCISSIIHFSISPFVHFSCNSIGTEKGMIGLWFVIFIYGNCMTIAFP